MTRLLFFLIGVVAVLTVMWAPGALMRFVNRWEFPPEIPHDWKPKFRRWYKGILQEGGGK